VQAEEPVESKKKPSKKSKGRKPEGKKKKKGSGKEDL
jgi:hypothetical protein